MSPKPWWLERVEFLSQSQSHGSHDVGALRHLSDRMREVRGNVDLSLLDIDFVNRPEARVLWIEFLSSEVRVEQALEDSRQELARHFSLGKFAHPVFLREWSGRGFAPSDDGAGTPADDFLDGVFDVERLSTGENRPEGGTVNMASRASRILDFIDVMQPDAEDVVFDLGSGSGKWALTVAASTESYVCGVEWGESYVRKSLASAAFYSIVNAEFIQGDVRDVNLSSGNIFHLYYPFHGEVARAVANTLGALARQKAITIYASGPSNGFQEYFFEQVTDGALRLREKRGEFSEVLVLESATPH